MRIVKHNMLIGKHIALRLVEIGDAELIVTLRTDARRNSHLSAVSPEVSAQASWLKRYKEREAAGSEYYFVIEADATAVGLLRMYDIEGPSFRWGSWIIRPGAPSYCAIESALILYDFAFESLGLTLCRFEVRKDNERVWAFHERMGATRVSEDDTQIFYEMSPSAYRNARTRYSKFL